jgi:nucleotide-binding universal stress UspA family protein
VKEDAVSFRKILVAVESEPVAAHAADVGAELARALGAEMAFVHVIDSSLGYPADTGVPPNEWLPWRNKMRKSWSTISVSA